jgi:hypothetical protein
VFGLIHHVLPLDPLIVMRADLAQAKGSRCSKVNSRANICERPPRALLVAEIARPPGRASLAAEAHWQAAAAFDNHLLRI